MRIKLAHCAHILLVVLTAAAITESAFGQANESVEEREEFQEFYKSQKKSRRSFFSSAPNHHITPKRDNITFAMQADLLDVSVAPALDEIPDDFSTLDHRLEMTGWSVFPLIAFSSETFGIGFTGEAGNRQIKFLSREKDTEEAAGSFFEQYSDMNYTGAGVYSFALLRGGPLPQWLAGTVILGARTLTAVHETRGTRTDSTTVPEATKLKYDVTVFDGGFNMAATLAKRFTVFPWVNYRKIQLGAVKDRNERSADAVLAEDVDKSIELDRELTWQSEPPLTYGLDFAIQIQRFELHLGGIFGYLANLNRGADRVHDDTINLSIAYDFKAK